MTIEGKKFSALTEQQKSDTREAILGYKEYIANLTTTYNRLYEGQLVVGHKYIIYAIESDDNFSNVGYQYDSSVFTATATTPTKWSNYTGVLDITEFVINVDVFINAIGDISFNFDQGTRYNINIDIPLTHRLMTKVTSDNPNIQFHDNNGLRLYAPDFNNDETFELTLTIELRLYPI